MEINNKTVRIAICLMYLISCCCLSCSSISKEEIEIKKQDDTIIRQTLNKKVPDSVLLMNFEKKEKILFGSISKKSEKLFYYFQFSNCDECIKRLLYYFSTHDIKGLIILSSANDYDKQELFALKHYYALSNDIYLLDKKQLKDIPALLVNKPFFFRVNEQGEMVQLHFVNYSLLSQTVRFLSPFTTNKS